MPDATTATPVVRGALPADAEALGRVTRLAYAATYEGIVPEAVLDEWMEAAPAEWRRALESQTRDSASRAWVAERDGGPLGYALTSPAKDRWLPPPDGAGEVTDLYLDPSAIGTGIGRLLFEHAVRDLRERGFEPLVVWAFRDNARARAFYERMGMALDVSDHEWLLGGVPCPIVRFRLDRAAGGAPGTACRG